MKTFVRVVEAGSFSAVAKELNTTQSAVSKQVAALEAYLEIKLLSRTTRSLALTEEGEQYFEHARRLSAEVEEVEISMRKGKKQLAGWFRIAASVGFGRLKLMPLIQSFMAKHPLLKVDVRLNDNFINLIEHGIDVGVRIGDLPDSSLMARRVGSSKRMLLAHRSYIRSLPAKGIQLPKLPEDLLQHNCLVYTELASRNDWRFSAGAGALEPTGTTKVVRVEGSLQTNSSEIIRATVLAGMGIAHAPTWLLEEEIKNGEVQRILPDWDSQISPINLVSPAERFYSAKVEAFAEHVAANIGSPN